MDLSFKKIFYTLACAAALLVLIYFGRPVLMSLTMALLLSFILYPVVQKLESWKLPRVSAAILTLMIIVTSIVGVFYLFGSQIMNVMEELSNFERKLSEMSNEVVLFINKNFSIMPSINGKDILDNGAKWVQESGGEIVKGTVSQTTAIVSGIMIVIVYTFLLLIYRSGLKKVIIESAPKKHHDTVAKMLAEMQQVGQKYLFGMSIMIAILGVANSAALLIIGVDHAFFFGFLAGLLAIIPYVGTTIGAGLPVLYTLMTYDDYLTPLLVVIAFWIIQLVESNFLSPKIVGGNMNINALAAILSLIIGGYLWGVGGMVLFLPLAAIFKVFCGYFNQLKPVGLLLGDHLYQNKKAK